MKTSKLIWLLFAIAALPFMMFLGTTTLSSCERVEKTTVDADSMETVEGELVFYTVDEVLNYQTNSKNITRTDQVFLNIKQPVLKQVATVLLKKYKNVTKESLVIEYLNNKAIYDNLLLPPYSAINDSTYTSYDPGDLKLDSGNTD